MKKTLLLTPMVLLFAFAFGQPANGTESRIDPVPQQPYAMIFLPYSPRVVIAALEKLRMGIWKQWKRPKTKMMNLQKLGINRQKSYEWSNSRKGHCRVVHSPILCRALNNDYFTQQRYIGFANYYFWKTEHQTKLF